MQLDPGSFDECTGFLRRLQERLNGACRNNTPLLRATRMKLFGVECCALADTMPFVTVSSQSCTICRMWFLLPLPSPPTCRVPGIILQGVFTLTLTGSALPYGSVASQT